MSPFKSSHLDVSWFHNSSKIFKSDMYKLDTKDKIWTLQGYEVNQISKLVFIHLHIHMLSMSDPERIIDAVVLNF